MNENHKKEKENKTVVKVVAIVGLVVLEVANLLTLNVDGGVLLAIGAIIGGIAGYEFKGIARG